MFVIWNLKRYKLKMFKWCYRLSLVWCYNPLHLLNPQKTHSNCQFQMFHYSFLGASSTFCIRRHTHIGILNYNNACLSGCRKPSRTDWKKLKLGHYFENFQLGTNHEGEVCLTHPRWKNGDDGNADLWSW